MYYQITPLQRLIGFIVFSLFSALFLFLANQQREENAELLQNGIDVQAKVVKVESTTSTRDGKTSTTYTPIFTFTDQTGNYQQMPQGFSSSPSTYGVGDVVPFRYHPNRPGLGRVNTFWQMHGAALAFGLIGMLLSLAALSYLTSWGFPNGVIPGD